MDLTGAGGLVLSFMVLMAPLTYFVWRRGRWGLVAVSVAVWPSLGLAGRWFERGLTRQSLLMASVLVLVSVSPAVAGLFLRKRYPPSDVGGMEGVEDEERRQ